MNFDGLVMIDYTWTNLLWLSLLLIAIYLLLLFTRRFLVNLVLLGRVRTTIRKSLDQILVLYEPIALMLFTVLFIMIRPNLHGLVIGVIVLFAFTHVRNYVNGKIIQAGRSLDLGRRILIGTEEGIITEMGNFGIKVRGDHGLHFVPYHILVSDGFTLSSGEKIGGYYGLVIKPTEEKESSKTIRELSDILISSPYVDGDHKPEISRSISSDGGIHVRILVKEESHLYDLLGLLEERGFISEILKS